MVTASSKRLTEDGAAQPRTSIPIHGLIGQINCTHPIVALVTSTRGLPLSAQRLLAPLAPLSGD